MITLYFNCPPPRASVKRIVFVNGLTVNQSYALGCEQTGAKLEG